MLTFCDLLVTEATVKIQIDLELLGSPKGQICIGTRSWPLDTRITHDQSATDAFVITVSHTHKTYQEPYEVAVVIRDVSIGPWQMTPAHNHLGHYTNDRDAHPNTRYLGFNGEWRLEIDQPFWLWHHHNTGQGMLISPVKLESRQNS